MDGTLITDITAATASSLYDLASLGYGQYRLADLGSLMALLDLGGLVGTLKTVAVYASLILGALFLFYLAKFRMLVTGGFNLVNELNPPAAARGGALRARWEEILRHMDSAKEAEWKFAVIEADKLVDDVLRKAGFPGDTLGERLMQIQDGQLVSLQGLWEAHKTRNRLAHETDYFLRYTEARHAIDFYEQALLELSAL